MEWNNPGSFHKKPRVIHRIQLVFCVKNCAKSAPITALCQPVARGPIFSGFHRDGPLEKKRFLW